jgi:hypothetical protein
MSTKKKLFLSAAGAAGGAGLDVDEVFSTYLYDGTGSAQTITNGIDLDGEGGLVWIKNRENQFQDHSLFDTTRSPSYVLYSNTTHASSLSASRFSSFNTNGFTVGTDTSTNESGKDIVSWTFRKASKFFDVVTYTGDGTAGRTISHNLGTTVGSIFIKRTDASSGWRVFHRSEGGTKYAMLQSTNAFASASTVWNNTNPTDSVFTVGSDTDTNGSGGSFVAYLFAHNDGDGEFGPDADQDVIKCGSYTGNGSTQDINLGFEPQWIMIKSSSTTGAWYIWDNMRGVVTGGNDWYLRANESSDESDANNIKFNSTGFSLENATVNANAENYIYIAIRRGPLAEPTSATDVFAMDDRSGGPPNAVSGFPVDMGLFTNKASTDNKYIGTRLTQGKRLYTNLTDVEGSSSELAFDYSTGFIDRSDTSTDNIHWMWKRAPSYFDVVTYSGNSSTNTLNHNLGVAPEMIWYKARDGAISWRVHANITSSGYDRLVLNDSAAKIDTETYGSTKELVSQPTATQLVLGSGSGTNNSSSYTYIAYLFATLAGISKVGNFTGTAATQTIDCGFSSGARFVLIKETNTSGGWMVFDTFRGIVSGNDARLELDDTGAESTASDILDPHSSGFQLPSSSFVNASGRECIFYAIA